MDATILNVELRLLDRLLVAPAAANALLEIRIPPEDIRRMEDLLSRNNQGLLSPEERSEMEAYAHLGAFLGIVHSKARQALQMLPNSAGAA